MGRTDLARNEEGEFELVLGNRQLVSVFLIVVVLLGVFFSMGYFVGRNSPATPVTDIASRPVNPIIVENPSKGASSSGESKPPAITPAPVSPAAENSAADAKPEPPRRAEHVEKAVEKTVEKPTPLPKEKLIDQRIEPASKPSVGTPRSGTTFLQVVATSRLDAELIGETLAKKGFHTVVAPGPNPTTFRVLVGPLHDQADSAETRVRLASAGFKNPYVRRY